MLIRAWIYCTGLIGLFEYAMLGAANATFQEWAFVTAILSGLLFVVVGGLVWVARANRVAR